MYVTAPVVNASNRTLNALNFDTWITYVSPVPLHTNAGVVSFVSAVSPGLVRLTVTDVSITSARVTLVSKFPASSRATTRQ